jgi:hypothetical protein
MTPNLPPYNETHEKEEKSLFEKYEASEEQVSRLPRKQYLIHPSRLSGESATKRSETKEE